ncbi:MAG TPA: rhodanese-like domain-containing protein, partial [Cyclobacteriaceae bacterium]|nr:rhodanese-like domain-containing protein [Cyclobacteriaceae bacterium]
RKGERFIIVDTRSKEGYDIEHIEGAISLPWRLMKDDAKKVLDKECTIVTYCNGIGCNGSTKGALILAEMGYKVKELTGGIVWWKRGEFPTEGVSVTGGNAVNCDC